MAPDRKTKAGCENDQEKLIKLPLAQVGLSPWSKWAYPSLTGMSATSFFSVSMLLFFVIATLI